MQKKKIYRVVTEGRVIDTPKKPKGVDYILRYRLIADEGMGLTNGLSIVPMIDVDADQVDQWQEIEWARESNG